MEKSAFSFYILVYVLVAVSLACGGSYTPKTLDLYPTSTSNPTQTPNIVKIEITTTPLPTSVPIVVSATAESGFLCVTAVENVYLRPTPSMENSPIVALPENTRLEDRGSRSGNWLFVAVKDKVGWVNSAYVKPCL